MSKETAVVLPFIFIITHLFLTLTKKIKVPVKTLVLALIPYFVILGGYLFLHFRYFGVISGDSYVWDFSLLRAVNSTVWYGLWSLNLPEMLIDFVGPGIHLNPNLLKYWSSEIIPIFILFTLQMLIVIYAFIRRKFSLTTVYFLLFSISWFVLTMAPVIFLPVHKFTYYLTLPLIGTVLFLSYLIRDSRFKILFCVFWITTSIISLALTYKTNWITQSQLVAGRVNSYFMSSGQKLIGKDIYFIDTENDSSLPWSPTTTLKTVLSDKSFFEVLYPNLKVNVNYSGLDQTPKSQNSEIIEARQFLGY
jgi:hypothetical protein